ncbi:hypothetical protein [Oceanithermus sp.]|nr:hypothetical protein [Oceanithermus sp.]
MLQESKTYPDFGQNELDQIFEIDFEGGRDRPMDEEEKQRIHQELMSLEW